LTHKKVNNADPGTATKFGGNDLDKWSDFASGVDTDDYDINSDFTVRSGKRYLRNPANTFSYQEIASAIAANRTITEPLLTGNDTRVYQAHTQALTNKTVDFDLNTIPHFQTAAYYTIYVAGSTVKCRDNVLGTVVSSSATNPETPIRHAITNGLNKKVYIAEGDYNLHSSFTEFVFNVNQAEMLIELSPGAHITVPNGYAGNLFNFQDGASLVKIVGGRYNEAGAQQRLWTAFNYESSGSSGVNSCSLYGWPYIRNAGKAIRIATTGTAPDGWTNNCAFEDVFVDRTVIGIDFSMGAGSFGCNRNYFRNVTIQAFTAGPGPTTTHGVRNIAGDGGEFHKVHVFDIGASDFYSTLTSNAVDTLIIGGRMTSTSASQYTDNGVRTQVYDKWLARLRRTGVFTTSGTGAQLTFSTPHGLGRTPSYWDGTAASAGTRLSPFYVSVDATNILFVFASGSAPANGVSLVWTWEVSG
jgi:hypothetical protein